jgi:hypothetical protein
MAPSAEREKRKLIMRGSSLGSRPCWRTKPQFFRDCSPWTVARSTTAVTQPPSGQGIGSHAADDTRSDDDVCVPLHKARP